MRLLTLIHRWPALAALAALVPGCKNGTDPDPVSACTGVVSISVGSGTVPALSWSPPCRLFLVLVEDPTGTGDQWGVLSDSSNGIAPPVHYGTVPEGATKELLPPVPLQAGHEYRLNVVRFTGPGHEDGEVIGQATFTP
jgi:hypothetical protein